MDALLNGPVTVAARLTVADEKALPRVCKGLRVRRSEFVRVAIARENGKRGGTPPKGGKPKGGSK
jgi:hypothetical protein